VIITVQIYRVQATRTLTFYFQEVSIIQGFWAFTKFPQNIANKNYKNCLENSEEINGKTETFENAVHNSNN